MPNAQDVGQVGALANAGEKLRDMGGVEPPAEQLIDRLQLGQVVVVVVRRSTDAPGRVEQAALPIGTDMRALTPEMRAKSSNRYSANATHPDPVRGAGRRCTATMHATTLAGRISFASEVLAARGKVC